MIKKRKELDTIEDIPNKLERDIDPSPYEEDNRN
jgi:hypothetical protein